jgi:hypothetical protein
MSTETTELEPNIITFNIDPDDTEVLRLSQEGFTYKGELIEDAGEAYNIFMEVMGRMNDSLIKNES